MKNMFIDPMLNLDSYKELIKNVEEGISPIATHGIIDENIGHICYGLKKHIDKQILIITYDQKKAEKIYRDIKNFDKNIVELFPSKDIMFYRIDALSLESAHKRLNVLSKLANGEPIIVVASIESLLNKSIDSDLFKMNTIKVDSEDTIKLDKIAESLISSGYERESMVEGIGQFSIRGGIIDVFSLSNENPYRIELFDDEVDSIRTFDIGSQRSIETIQSIIIPPVKEVLVLDEYKDLVVEGIQRDIKRGTSRLKENSMTKQNIEDKFYEYIEEIKESLHISNMDMIVPYIPEKYLSNVLEYFKKGSLVFIDDPRRVEKREADIRERFRLDYSHVLEAGEVLSKHEEINYDYKNIMDYIEKKTCIGNTALLKSNPGFKPKLLLKFSSRSMQSFHKNMEFLKEELERYKYRGYKVIIVTATEEKGKMLESTLMERDVESIYVEDEDREIKTGQVFIIEGNIQNGFEYDGIKFAVIGDKEIYGSVKRKSRRSKKKSKKEIINYSDLSAGDYVVHENHGVGRYEGVEQLDIQGIKKDYLTINYRGNDKLYVPVDQMNFIQKYVGADSIKPKINKLSSQEWVKTKNTAKKAVEDMAEDLVELYAKRKDLKGHAFPSDTLWQREFEDMFPYEETDAQLRSAEEIKKGMEDKKPLDTLLCGDVGYGKTEVALRAAFKAIMDGKQVAFLVPTTILAQQHYNTIVERFKSFPINIGVLSRFRTVGQQKATIKSLGKGMVDIVVGTHRLLSRDIKFKDLGLLIVDEEQRFGVKHKEKLKQLKENVDVLTLTATPIPRTLHMSLVGIRDMSTIDEPPEERYPVQTYVVEFNEQMIREAILKEVEREGQVYFVYNRVKTIDRMAMKLKELIPEARIAVAHGQMRERALEKIMLDFEEGEYDILVCTTIIETGLDIQNVNTMIIYNADKMGLSQLYQLRGRVGRTNRIAYSYFTYEKDKVLTEVAERRLRAIKDFTEFGSGFKIAMRDLEIRGAGNLLGLKQHGHIDAIGYDLYVKYLNETVKKLKGEVVEETIDTTIDLAIDGYISGRYIEDEGQKIEAYKKIASIVSIEDYRELIDELIDRFGDIPREVENLMDVSYIKNNAGKSHINNIIQSDDIVTLEFSSSDYITRDLIDYLSREYRTRIRFSLSDTPSFKYRYKNDVLWDLKDLVDNIRDFQEEKELEEKAEKAEKDIMC